MNAIERANWRHRYTCLLGNEAVAQRLVEDIACRTLWRALTEHQAATWVDRLLAAGADEVLAIAFARELDDIGDTHDLSGERLTEVGRRVWLERCRGTHLSPRV